jgi:large subunit ribosomal protein L17
MIRSGHIETTEARAKAVRPIVEKLITIAKQKDLAGRRLIASRVQNPRITKKLCDDLGPRYADRKGGYIRITKLQTVRKRDGVTIARVEFV